MASDQEVAEAKKVVAKLRAQLQGLRLGQGQDNLQEASNDITMAALETEAVALAEKIDAAKQAAKKSTVSAGVAQMKQAIQSQSAGSGASTSKSEGSDA